jgi:hypothetical protein
VSRGEGGQATIEWSALALLVALVLGALGYAAVRSDVLGLGRGIVEAIVCNVGDGCPNALEEAYGDELAGARRRHAPNVVYERGSAQLPVDFRRCRKTSCSDGDSRAAEASASDVGLPVTAFTRVMDGRSRGGSLYLQYWLYFPESFTGAIGRVLGPLVNRWPGYHADDWEGVQLRITGARVSARATAHGGYSGLKDASDWGAWTGWYRVSGGSHAGRLVHGANGERTTPASALRLVPLETLRSEELYRFEVTPPWKKAVYANPEAASS